MEHFSTQMHTTSHQAKVERTVLEVDTRLRPGALTRNVVHKKTAGILPAFGMHHIRYTRPTVFHLTTVRKDITNSVSEF